MRFKAYFKPIEFEAGNLQKANEIIDCGDFYQEVECDLIEEIGGEDEDR